MNRLKSNKGITLLELSLYIIVILIIMGVLTSIRTFFFKNVDVIEESSRYASSFDKFNNYFVSDVKNNYHVKVETNPGSTTIIFEDGTTYIYNVADGGIYRGKIKIASNVTAFTVNKKNILINSVQKEVVSINIAIGDSNANLFNKKIDYTLRYW